MYVCIMFTNLQTVCVNVLCVHVVFQQVLKRMVYWLLEKFNEKTIRAYNLESMNFYVS